MFGLFKKARMRAPQSPPLRRGQLVPRIKDAAYVRALDRAGVPPEQRPVITPLCGELLVTYAFDLPDNFMMASAPMLRRAGIGFDEMARLAIRNFQRTLPEPQFLDSRGCGLADVGGDLEATLLLVNEIWDAIVPTLSGELVVAAPRRNRLLMCDSANLEAMAQLRSQAQEFFMDEQEQHALSPQLMVRRGSGWALYEQ